MRNGSRLDEAYYLLDVYREKLSLPDHVVVRAREVFERVKDTAIAKYRGRNWLGAMMAASVCIACRESGLPVRFRDLWLEFPAPRELRLVTMKLVTSVEAARAYKMIVETLGLRVQQPNPYAFLHLIAGRLELDRPTVERAEKLLREAVECSHAMGKQAATLAAAAIYAVCRQWLKPGRLEKASGVKRGSFMKHAETLSAYFLE